MVISSDYSTFEMTDEGQARKDTALTDFKLIHRRYVEDIKYLVSLSCTY